MPKKTRREKIIADYRKKFRLLNDPSVGSTSVASIPSPVSPPPVNHHSSLVLDPKELWAIKRDLVRTVLLATLAIAAESALFWFWKK